jgi:uncharacterized protein YbjT (DUF2867 family)
VVATNDRTVTVFGGTGFLGRRIVRRLRYRGFPVRIASRHPDRGHSPFGPDDPQLQSIEADIHDERSVADALAGAYGVVNAVSLYVEHDRRLFIPFTSRLLNGQQFKRTALESNALFTFQESAPMLPHHPATSESAAKANWRSGPRSPMRFSSARR